MISFENDSQLLQHLCSGKMRTFVPTPETPPPPRTVPFFYFLLSAQSNSLHDSPTAFHSCRVLLPPLAQSQTPHLGVEDGDGRRHQEGDEEDRHQHPQHAPSSANGPI